MPTRALCTALAQAEAGAIAAVGTPWTTVANADPAPSPRWYFFNGVRTNAEAVFPIPSPMFSYAYKILEKRKHLTQKRTAENSTHVLSFTLTWRMPCLAFLGWLCLTLAFVLPWGCDDDGELANIYSALNKISWAPAAKWTPSPTASSEMLLRNAIVPGNG